MESQTDVTRLVSGTSQAVAKAPPPHLQRGMESQTASISGNQAHGPALSPFDRTATPSSGAGTTSASLQPPAVTAEGSLPGKYVAVPGQRYLEFVPHPKAAPKALPFASFHTTYTRYTGAGAEHRSRIVICGFTIIMARESASFHNILHTLHRRRSRTRAGTVICGFALVASRRVMDV